MKKSMKAKTESLAKTTPEGNGAKSRSFNIKKYRIPIIVASVVLAVLVVTGVVMSVVSSGGTVNVYSVENVCMTDYWGDNNESYGPVTSDQMQIVYVSETQKVTELFVAEGQEVKKGDKLLSYDTTLSDIELEKKSLEVNNMRLELKSLKTQLNQVNAMVPYTPKPTVTPVVDKGVAVDTYLFVKGAGTAADPMIYTVNSSFAGFDSDFIMGLFTGGVTKIYIVYQTREGNLSKGDVISSLGLMLNRTALGYTAMPFDGSGFIVYTPVSDTDVGGGLTAGEIAEMRSGLVKQISELTLEVKIADIEYQQMQHELDAGIVVAEVDGVVVSVEDPNEALINDVPVLKLSGGGGYYIQGQISETFLSDIKPGDVVTVTSFETGTQCEGTVTEVFDIPVSSDMYGYGGNVSYYPFTVFVDESADLQENYYVSISYNSQTSSGGTSMYLDNAFLRIEGGKSYIWVEENGQLAKRYVVTGANIWGSYTQIRSGLALEDYIAFPYGKGLKEGASVKQCPIDELYNSIMY